MSLPDEQGNTPKAYLNSPSYDYLAKLTTDPDALLAKIYKETRGHLQALGGLARVVLGSSHEITSRSPEAEGRNMTEYMKSCQYSLETGKLGACR
ncbi:hypothetical protein ACWC2T_37560 [Streptomyces sp. NPDC001393]